MKSPKSEAKAGPKVGTVGGTIRPLLATIKQALVTMPGINRLIPGGRKPVTHLYPYQKVELPVAFRGQHSIDWFKCIGCELCAKVCPNECIYFEFYEVEPTSEYLHPSRAQREVLKKYIRLHEVHRMSAVRRRLSSGLPTHGGNRLQGSGRILPHQPPGRSEAARGAGREVTRRLCPRYSYRNCRPFILFPLSDFVPTAGRL